VARAITVSVIFLMSEARSLLFFPSLAKPLEASTNRTSLLSPLLPQHEDDGGDAGAEEDIGRQADDGFKVVVLDQVVCG
jgi:hypothetical protein